MEPHMLGWRPLMISWLNTLPEGVSDEIKEVITELFDRMVIPVTQWIRKGSAKVNYYWINLNKDFCSGLCPF